LPQVPTHQGETTRRAAWRHIGRLSAAALLLTAAVAAPVAAQTLTLSESNATVLRGGSYANTNLSSDVLLVTRASGDPTYVRRVVMKFDTQTGIPLGNSIASATLTVTVAGGNAESRVVSARRVTVSHEETEASWNRRNASTAWSTPGGDLAEVLGNRTVTNVPGSRVTFDVTALVQAVVNGDYGSSRYTRIALVDEGGSSKDSYKEYYSDEAGDVSVRPTLTVTLGSTPVTPPTPAPTAGVSLRMLQWNLHHGVGTDGVYNIDRIATWIAKMTPDIVMLNEVEKYTGWGNEDQPARYKALVESKTGKKWYSLFAQEFGDWTSNGKGHLILSRFPLESTGLHEISYSRVIGEAHVTVNGRSISLLVTHLDPDSSTSRLTQAKEVIVWAATFPENRILTGDMNAWPDQTSIAEFNKVYNDSFAVATGNGTATGVSGISPFGATKNGRIDYILYSKGASNLVVKASKVYDTRDANGVMPSDHRPVVTTFEVR